MFRKNSSKLLTFLNVLLLLQIVGAVIGFLAILAMILFPSDGLFAIKTNPGDLLYPLMIGLVAGGGIYLVNWPLKRLFNLENPTPEKLFNLICIQSINGTTCGLLCLIVAFILYNTNESAVFMQTIFRFVILDGIYVGAIALARKFKIFRQDFSAIANYSNGIFTLAASTSAGWFINCLFDLMFSGKDNYHMYYDPTIVTKRNMFISFCLTFVFAAIVFAVIKFAVAKPAKKKIIESVPEVTSETVVENTTIIEEKPATVMEANRSSEEMQAMQAEIEALKQQLAEKQAETAEEPKEQM